jgi:hypothetical protein
VRVFHHVVKAFNVEIPWVEKLVLLYLSTRIGTTGECFPKVKTISCETGLSLRGVFSALTALEKAGLVERTKVEHNKITRYLVRWPPSMGAHHTYNPCPPYIQPVPPMHTTGDQVAPKYIQLKDQLKDQLMAAPGSGQKSNSFPKKEEEEVVVYLDEVLKKLSKQDGYIAVTPLGRVSILWRTLLVEQNHVAYVKPFTQADKGKLSKLIKDYGEAPLTRAFRAVLMDWAGFVGYCKATKLTGHVPLVPSLGFVLQFSQVVLNYGVVLEEKKSVEVGLSKSESTGKIEMKVKIPTPFGNVIGGD